MKKFKSLPSSTSAETNKRRPEQMYCGSEYGKITWKLSRTPMQTIISDVNRICLQQIENMNPQSNIKNNTIFNNTKALNGSLILLTE